MTTDQRVFGLRRRVHAESATLSVREAIEALELSFGMRPATGTLDAYEAAWSVALGHPSVAVASGRGAIELALRASGVGPGDTVLVTGYTCIAVPAAVCATGAQPEYVDVDPATGTMSLETIERHLQPGLSAVIVQHTLGNPAPTEAIVRRLGGTATWVIEDAAHAIGAREFEAPMRWWGDWVATSTEQSKVLSTGVGGVVAAVSERARGVDLLAHLGEPLSDMAVRRWLMRIGAERLAFGLGDDSAGALPQVAVRLLHRAGLGRVRSDDRFEGGCSTPSWRRARIHSTQAQIGLGQLRRLDAILDHRREIAGLYGDAFAGRLPGLVARAGVDPVWVRWPVRTVDARLATRRLDELGWDLGGRWFDTPVYPSQIPPSTSHYVPGSCPGAENLTRQILNLPTHPLVTGSLARRLAAAVLEVADPPSPVGPG